MQFWCKFGTSCKFSTPTTPVKSSLSVLLLLFLLPHGLHGGEEQNVPYGIAVGEQHYEAVEAEAQAARGGHAVFQGVDEVLVHLGVDALGLNLRRNWCTFGALWCTVQSWFQ